MPPPCSTNSTAAFRRASTPSIFSTASWPSSSARHARFDDSAYKLEPNLKDSPGGLRDLHTIHWLAQACGITGGWNGLARAGLLTHAEARRIAREERSLSALRIHLHILARRRDDRLAFDYQTELAERLGLAATAHKRAGERLMQGYYRAAKLIQRANDILIQSLRVRLFPVTAPPQPIDADFQVRANLLEARATRPVRAQARCPAARLHRLRPAPGTGRIRAGARCVRCGAAAPTSMPPSAPIRRTARCS